LSPRYKKPRFCGCQLKGKAFKPTGISMIDVEKIILYDDEIEALKLCDLDGFSQNEAGKRMGISRGTIQRLLSNAREKLAMALSQCKAIVFEKTICKQEKQK